MMRRSSIFFLFIATACSNYLDAKPFAYVANVQSSTVSVIDCATNTVIKTIAMSGGPIIPAITHDNKLVYVSCSGDNTLKKIDVATNTIVGDPIPTGPFPAFVLIMHPDSKAYVGNLNGAAVMVLDLKTDTFIKTIVVEQRPSQMALSPDGAFLYVACEDSNAVVVIDTATDTVIDTFTATSALGVNILSDYRLGYVSSRSLNVVYPFDPITHVLGTAIPVGSQPQLLTSTRDSRFLYVPNQGSASVSVIDTATNTVIATIAVQLAPTMGALTPNQTRLYVTNFGANSVSPIDTATNVAGTAIPVGIQPIGIAITPVPRPEGVRANLIANKFLNKTECVVLTQWTAPASISIFRIYRGMDLIATVTGTGTITFPICLACGQSAQGFFIASVDELGGESVRVPIRPS